MSTTKNETTNGLPNKFNNNVSLSLNEILEKLSSPTEGIEGENEQLERDLLTLHRIKESQYKAMCKAYENDTKTIEVELKKKCTIKEFNDFDVLNPKQRKFLALTFSETQNSDINQNVVLGHAFGNCVSCYSKTFLEILFKTYNTIKIVKVKDKLTNVSLGREGYERKYEGKINMIAIHCSNAKDKTRFKDDYFDVAHDPDGNP